MENKIHKTCYTIGHSNHSIENFLKILDKWEIEYLIDVRSVPYSKHTKQFNKEELTKQIREIRLQYRYLGNMLGGGIIRFHSTSHNTPKLKEIQRNKKFKKGINILNNFILQKKKIVLMCSEKDPYTCHRFFLVSYCLQKKGVKINHILYNGDIISNKALENKLKQSIPHKTILNYNKRDLKLDDLYEKHYLDIYKKYST